MQTGYMSSFVACGTYYRTAFRFRARPLVNFLQPFVEKRNRYEYGRQSNIDRTVFSNGQSQFCQLSATPELNGAR